MSKRILIVDDSASARQVAGMALTHAGYEVVEANDGEDKESQGRAAGAKVWITNPFQPQTLVDVVSKLVLA